MPPAIKASAVQWTGKLTLIAKYHAKAPVEADMIPNHRNASFVVMPHNKLRILFTGIPTTTNIPTGIISQVG